MEREKYQPKCDMPHARLPKASFHAGAWGQDGSGASEHNDLTKETSVISHGCRIRLICLNLIEIETDHWICIFLLSSLMDANADLRLNRVGSGLLSLAGNANICSEPDGFVMLVILGYVTPLVLGFIHFL